MTQEMQDYYQKNLYLNLATVAVDGEPWNCPVFFAFDEQGALYFRSVKDSQHVLNINQHPSVFITIYDSTQEIGTSKGLYLQATVERIEDELQTQAALIIMDKRSGLISDPKRFIGDGPKRVFKVTPTRAWLNHATITDAGFMDTREEVELV